MGRSVLVGPSELRSCSNKTSRPWAGIVLRLLKGSFTSGSGIIIEKKMYLWVWRQGSLHCVLPSQRAVGGRSWTWRCPSGPERGSPPSRPARHRGGSQQPPLAGGCPLLTASFGDQVSSDCHWSLPADSSLVHFLPLQ